MSQGSLNPKIRFLGQKVWPVARGRTDGQTDGHTRKWKQRAPFQGFRSFSFNLSSRIGPIYLFITRNWLKSNNLETFTLVISNIHIRSAFFYIEDMHANENLHAQIHIGPFLDHGLYSQIHKEEFYLLIFSMCICISVCSHATDHIVFYLGSSVLVEGILGQE